MVMAVRAVGVAESAFFEFVRERLERLGLQQKDVAADIDMPPSTFSAFVNGNVQSVSVERLAKLAPILGVPFETLCRLATGQPQDGDADTLGALSPRSLTLAAIFDALDRQQQDGLWSVAQSMKRPERS